MGNVFSKVWSTTINLGIKCNSAPIVKKIGYQYFSSPFDNMDSVNGLVQSGHLIAIRFENYWDNLEKWRLRNDRGVGQAKIRNKIVWHEDYPGLYYPHFYAGWLNGVTAEQVQAWIADPEGSLDFVWEGLERTFRARQDRVVRLLDSGQSLLFVRIDERRQMRRLQSRTLANDARRFMELMTGAYPNADVGLLCYYCSREGERVPQDTDRITFVPIPDDMHEPEFVHRDLVRLRLRPREDLILA